MVMYSLVTSKFAETRPENARNSFPLNKDEVVDVCHKSHTPYSKTYYSRKPNKVGETVFGLVLSIKKNA